LRKGRCTTNPRSWLFGQLAASLHPDHAWSGERRALRSLVTSGEHETRAEFAAHLVAVEGELSEAELLHAVRPSCSATLGSIVDAVVGYERFAALVDAAFRTLCSVSHSMGAQSLTAHHVEAHEMIVRCARDLPDHYRTAAEQMTAIGADSGLEERLGAFAIPRTPTGLFELLLEHHERVQAGKPPNGKRPWFEPLRHGWVVRSPYGTAEQPELGAWFVHPVRVAALRRFLEDTRT
jgi:RNase P/RNase MRP subunit POP5